MRATMPSTGAQSMYCPACSGHGTNVHECAESRSVVVLASDLAWLLDVCTDNGMADNGMADNGLDGNGVIIGRLRSAVIGGVTKAPV